MYGLEASGHPFPRPVRHSCSPPQGPLIKIIMYIASRFLNKKRGGAAYCLLRNLQVDATKARTPRDGPQVVCMDAQLAIMFENKD